MDVICKTWFRRRGCPQLSPTVTTFIVTQNIEHHNFICFMWARGQARADSIQDFQIGIMIFMIRVFD